MSYAKSLIQKYIDLGIIQDNTEKTDWFEIIGSIITVTLIGVLGYLWFSIAI